MSKAHIFFLLATSLLYTQISRAGQPRVDSKKLLVLDQLGDKIDGPGFVDSLQAYVGEIGVVTKRIKVLLPLNSHDEWVALASAQGKSEEALAVIWFEPIQYGQKNFNVFIVFLEWASGAEIVLPVKLGARRGPAMFRVLAATTRMVLDTGLLDDCKEVMEVAEQETPPDPWPAPKKRSFDLHLGYLGDLGLSGPTVLHGGRIGGFVHPSASLGIGLDIGFLTRKRTRIKGIEMYELRLPIRVNLGWFLPLGPTEAAVVGFWSVDITWVSAAGIPTADGETIEMLTRTDTGAGLELRLHIPIAEKLGFFLAIAGQGMVVSYSYEHRGDVLIPPNYFRLGWNAGLDFVGLNTK